MDHIASLKSAWHLLDAILAGTKTIESRWYVHKRPPYDHIAPDDVVYFAEGGVIGGKAIVKKVEQHDDLTPGTIRQLFEQYVHELGLPPERLEEFIAFWKDKRYCVLIFLEKPERVAPFRIKKDGYGTMAAWITTEDIQKIKE